MENTLPKGLITSSLRTGAFIGILVGLAEGVFMGALTLTLNAIFVGAVIGALTGVITGPIVGAIVARWGGTTGGVSIGAYTGMLVGAGLGLVAGVAVSDYAATFALIRETNLLNAFALDYFQSAMFSGFLVSVLGTAVGSVVGGANKRLAS